MPETRSSRRVPHVRMVRVRCESWRHFSELYTANLSRGGVFVRHDRPPPVLTPVRLQIALPDGRELTLRGRVAHVVSAERATAQGLVAGMGVEFRDLDDATRDELASLAGDMRSRVRGLTPPPVDLPIEGRSDGDAAVDDGDADAISLRTYLASLRERNPFAVLEVPLDSDDGDILMQYQQLASRFSPECYGAASPAARAVAAEIAILFAQAYELLSDPAQREGLARETRADGRGPAADVEPPIEPAAPGPDGAGALSETSLFGDLDVAQNAEDTAPLRAEEISRVESQPTHDWHRAGLALLGAHNFRKAREMLHRAVQADPPNTLYQRDYHVARAFELQALGRFDDAVEDFKRALEIDPNCQVARKATRALVEQGRVRRTGTLNRLLKLK